MALALHQACLDSGLPLRHAVLLAVFVASDFTLDFVNFGQLMTMVVVITAHMFRRYYPDVQLRYTR